jgi:hypothetical protein
MKTAKITQVLENGYFYLCEVSFQNNIRGPRIEAKSSSILSLLLMTPHHNQHNAENDVDYLLFSSVHFLHSPQILQQVYQPMCPVFPCLGYPAILAHVVQTTKYDRGAVPYKKWCSSHHITQTVQIVTDESNPP